MKIVFFGTPAIAASVLEYLHGHQVPISAIITKPDKPKGRSKELIPTPVKVMTQRLDPSIPIFQPELVSAAEFAPVLEQLKPDLFVVVAYGEIIKQHLLDMPKLGCINLHASILPKYRGAAPIQRCIMQGDLETGVSIMYMVRKMDAGDVIQTVKIPIGPNMTAGDLEIEMGKVGSRALLEVIYQFKQGPVKGTPQNADLATLAPKVELEDCRIFWGKPAAAIHNLVRGANPEPGAWCDACVRGESKRLKIWSTLRFDEDFHQVGRIFKKGRGSYFVGCGKGSIELLEVQLEGKKRMPAHELFNGISPEEMQLDIEA